MMIITINGKCKISLTHKIKKKWYNNSEDKGFDENNDKYHGKNEL